MAGQTRWWLVGAGIGLLLSLACWMECDHSYYQWFTSINNHSPYSTQQLLKDKAEHSNRGLNGEQYSMFGFDVESKHDWLGCRPAEYRGLPGGRWTLNVGVFLICTIAGCVMSLLQRRQPLQLDGGAESVYLNGQAST